MEQLAASGTNADLAEYYLSDEFRTQYMKVSVWGLWVRARERRAGVVASSAAQFARFAGAGSAPRAPRAVAAASFGAQRPPGTPRAPGSAPTPRAALAAVRGDPASGWVRLL